MEQRIEEIEIFFWTNATEIFLGASIKIAKKCGLLFFNKKYSLVLALVVNGLNLASTVSYDI